MYKPALKEKKKKELINQILNFIPLTIRKQLCDLKKIKMGFRIFVWTV